MLKVIEGVIASETKFSETSKILNIITKDGIIGVIAKGANNMKSPLRAFTTKLTYGKFHIYYKEGKLSTLKEVDIINNFNIIKNDLILISYFSYLTDLTYQIARENYSSELYNNYIDALLKIEDKQNPQVITNIFEVKALDFLGVNIDFNNCSKCSLKLNQYNLSIKDGLLCASCYNNNYFYSEKAAKMLKMYYYIDIKTIKDIKIDEEVIKEIDHFISHYYDDYTGLYLKSKKFLNDMRGN